MGDRVSEMETLMSRLARLLMKLGEAMQGCYTVGSAERPYRIRKYGFGVSDSRRYRGDVELRNDATNENVYSVKKRSKGCRRMTARVVSPAKGVQFSSTMFPEMENVD